MRCNAPQRRDTESHPDAGDLPALIPFSDMLNHDTDARELSHSETLQFVEAQAAGSTHNDPLPPILEYYQRTKRA
mgnify:CR=1 FL=1